MIQVPQHNASKHCTELSLKDVLCGHRYGTLSTSRVAVPSRVPYGALAPFSTFLFATIRMTQHPDGGKQECTRVISGLCCQAKANGYDTHPTVRLEIHHTVA